MKSGVSGEMAKAAAAAISGVMQIASAPLPRLAKIIIAVVRSMKRSASAKTNGVISGGK